jgi:hypothetical protein
VNRRPTINRSLSIPCLSTQNASVPFCAFSCLFVAIFLPPSATHARAPFADNVDRNGSTSCAVRRAPGGAPPGQFPCTRRRTFDAGSRHLMPHLSRTFRNSPSRTNPHIWRADVRTDRDTSHDTRHAPAGTSRGVPTATRRDARTATFATTPLTTGRSALGRSPSALKGLNSASWSRAGHRLADRCEPAYRH